MVKVCIIRALPPIIEHHTPCTILQGQGLLTHVRDIAQQWLDWNKLGPMAGQYQSLIDEDVKLDTRKLYSYESFKTGLSGSEDSLQRFVERRREFLLKVTTPGAEMK